MDIMLMRFIGDEEVRMEKVYDFDQVGFIPRKGDILEDEAFMGVATVTDVQLNIDGGYCVVYLSNHDLTIYPKDNHEEIINDYYKNSWITT